MRSPVGIARAVVRRSGLTRITGISRSVSELAEAIEENQLLDVALAERVAYLEQAVGEIAHKRSTASTDR